MKLVSIPAPMEITSQMMVCNEGCLAPRPQSSAHLTGLSTSCFAAVADTVSLLLALSIVLGVCHSCKNDMQRRLSDGQPWPSAWLPTRGGRLIYVRCWTSSRPCSMPLPMAQACSCSQTCTQALAAPSQCWTSYWLCVTPWSGTRRTYSATPSTTPCWGRWGRLRCAPGCCDWQ